MGITVAIDAFRLVAEPLTSGAFYVSELVKGLSAQSDLEKIYLLLPRVPGNDFIYKDVLAEEKVEPVCAPKDVYPEVGFEHEVYWIQRMIVRLLRTIAQPIDYFIAPYHHPPLFCPKRIRVITVIHDLCGLKADCGYRKTKKGFYYHLFRFLIAAVRSDILIPISQYTKSDLIAHFPFLSRRATRVVYNGISNELINDSGLKQTLKKFDLDKKAYFLAFASPGLRKGFDLTLAAYRMYRDLGGETCLVLITSKTYLATVTEMIEFQCRLGVLVVTDIETIDRDALYRGAVALLFPSRCEGFGYPVVEAMRQGCPPIAYKESPASEIVESCLPLLKDLGIERIVNQMTDYDRMELHKKCELGLLLRRRSLLFTCEAFGGNFLEAMRESCI